MSRSGEPSDIDGYLGSRISLRRSALGLSQTALARQLGISFQQVQKYETGTNRISASRLHRVATILNTSVESFFPSAGEEVVPKTLMSSREGRTLALDFPLIERSDIRKAVARLVAALAHGPGSTAENQGPD